MSSDPPTIKFSPFEALLIGEKNKILRRQPMKNTIFVSRLNHPSKTINLRDLFGLDKDETKASDSIFKMPQRVQDFLKNRKKRTKETRGNDNKKEILCYEFEGKKIKEATKSKRKKGKFKSNFKRKRKKKDKVKTKAVRKFANSNRNNYVKCKAVLKRKWKSKATLKEKYLAKVVMYVKEKKRHLDGVENVEVVLEKVKFDTGEEDMSKESMIVSPKPNVLNFDDDKNLLDIIYENFPKIVKFKCESYTEDFSKALLKAGLVKPEINLRYLKNGLLKNEILEILCSPFPLVRCQRVNNIKPNQCIIINRCASEIDGGYLEQNHVMKRKGLGSFFSNSSEGKVYWGRIK